MIARVQHERRSLLFEIYVAGQLVQRAWRGSSSAAADARGFPTMAALRRVAPSTGAVTTEARPTKPVDVHGLVPFGRGVLLADNTNGALYRVS